MRAQSTQLARSAQARALKQQKQQRAKAFVCACLCARALLSVRRRVALAAAAERSTAAQLPCRMMRQLTGYNITQYFHIVCPARKPPSSEERLELMEQSEGLLFAGRALSQLSWAGRKGEEIALEYLLFVFRLYKQSNAS